MALTQHSGDGYKDYTQRHDYADSPGVIVAPSSNRLGSARLLRVHGKYATRTVTWSAVRDGAPPVVPAAGDTDGDTFIGGTVSLPLPAANARDGTYTFAASGVYGYLQDTPRVPGTDPLPTGGYPYTLAVQDTVAGVRYKDEIAAAVTSGDPNPAAYVVAAAGLAYTGSAATGWYLTGLPAQTFSPKLISG